MLLGGFFPSLGCDGEPADSAAELPPLDTSETFRQDSGTFPVDTSIGTDSGADDTPDHWLTMRQEGTWGFASGDEAITGELIVTELLDGDTELPACAETWALVGLLSEAACDGCEATFDVEHTRVTSEGECLGADLPEDGEVRTLGYDGTTIWWDYGGVGVWVPLYAAGPGEELDTVAFAWESTVAIYVEEDDE